jgi:homoserine acetyltransferase
LIYLAHLDDVSISKAERTDHELSGPRICTAEAAISPQRHRISSKTIAMSKHRVKSVALDDDFEGGYDYDDDEEAGLSVEDKEQMRIGTIQVQELLGTEFSATDDEIQEALWHYYYDVAKSVSYIKSRDKVFPWFWDRLL